MTSIASYLGIKACSRQRKPASEPHAADERAKKRERIAALLAEIAEPRRL